jgi:hypothetical protein
MDNFKPIGAVVVNVMTKCAAQANVPIIRPRYPGVAIALAHHLARRAVETELRAQGLRPTHVPYTRVLAMMDAYKAAHLPALLAHAAALVQRSPKLRKMAEREEREFDRERRKRAKAGVLEKRTSPPV